MELWVKSDDQNHPQRRRIRRENPSFSSSLLDAIYRSIDESNGKGDDGELIFYRETTMKTKQSIAGVRTEDGESNETVKFRRDCMIEKWMDKKKVRNVRDFTVSSSSSSESTSTAGRRFSSSETEYISRRKPISRTTDWTQPEIQNPNHENGFVKTKSKASKIYHDLKKVKQPISPGGRLATFLNSLFNVGSPKTKRKIPNASLDCDISTKSKSTCSSASSISRSCLSKTTSSRGNVKRSVRFCPVSVIVDEDCRPCGHKILEKLEEPIMKKGLKSYGKTEIKMKINGNQGFDYEDYDDDDDDAGSCSSSDLFELDNLSVIGVERYREELPVYETTNFKTNCAIAKGLIV